LTEIKQHIAERPYFEEASSLAEEMEVKIFVVGGYIRDLILKRELDDIDILVIGDGLEFAQKFAERLGVKNVSLFKTFGTAMLHFNDIEIEFVGARKESYNRNSRKPIVEDGTFADDQIRRDFTVNTLAISLNKNNLGELIDPFGVDPIFELSWQRENNIKRLLK